MKIIRSKSIDLLDIKKKELNIHMNINLIEENEIQYCEEILGKGGFGVVIKGSWQNTDVALKQIEVEKDQLKSIQNELLFLSKYRHPRIIGLYGVNIVQYRMQYKVTFVMECMDCDLECYIDRNKLEFR